MEPRGWWLFAGTSAVALLSKYAICSAEHVFNPSNIGLVLCFLLFGPELADPLDLWWGPLTWWLVLALVVIVAGGLAILRGCTSFRSRSATGSTFAAGIGVLAASGHVMYARWHVGPITGLEFWRVLVSSPEVLVFLFFMITDPRTIPARAAVGFYAVGVALLAVLLIAPQTTEFWTKVALLGALAIVCAARPLLLVAAEAPRVCGRGAGRAARRPPSRGVAASPRPRPARSSCLPGCRHDRAPRRGPARHGRAPSVTDLLPSRRRWTTRRRSRSRAAVVDSRRGRGTRTRDRGRASRGGDGSVAGRPVEHGSTVAGRRDRSPHLERTRPARARARRGSGAADS